MEKGVTFPTQQVDLRNNEQLGDTYKAINPRCTVPALKLPDGRVLGDNASIVRYVEEICPEPPLLGQDPVDKALVAEWNAIAEAEGLLAMAEAIRNFLPGFKGRALPGEVSFEQIPALAERGQARVKRFFATLDKRLTDSAFLAGDNFSWADITAYVVVEFAGWIKIQPEDNQAALTAWRESISARPSAKA